MMVDLLLAFSVAHEYSKTRIRPCSLLPNRAFRQDLQRLNLHLDKVAMSFMADCIANDSK